MVGAIVRDANLLGKFNVSEFPYQADTGFVQHRGM
jgi:hypothetical protein